MLSELLPLKPGMIVALIGAGGKTTTMFRLAAEQAARGLRVITTTTTYIFPPGAEQTGTLVLETDRAALLAGVAAALARQLHITAATAATPEGKLRGVPPEWVADLLSLPKVDFVLVEADGAKGRMLKAPAEHEPAIPSTVHLVLLLASAEALGMPLSDAIAHRLDRVEAITSLKAGEILTPQALARLAAHQEGLLKGVPQGVPAVLALTHVDERNLDSAEKTARHALASGRLAGVLLCSLEWAQFRKNGA
ncbi:MAG TPA: selenium cofactor biosynthesis protein YqeC [Ktedonobacterales bacterium]|jgi:probable selenium-dependent hydroxylase accessory protein YqeC